MMPFEILRAELSPGSFLLGVERPLKSASLLVAFPIGLWAEPGGKEGLLNVFSQMVFKRGMGRGEVELMRDIEGMGASAYLRAGYDALFLYVKSTVDVFQRVVEKVFSYIAHSEMEAEELARVKKKIGTDLLEAEQDPRYVAGREFRRILFGEGHPYSRHPGGTLRGVSAVELGDLEYVKDMLGRRGVVSAVVGGVGFGEAESILGEALDTLGDGIGGGRALEGTSRLESRRAVRVEMPGKAQAVAIIGNVAVARNHPDFHKLTLANDILGSFGLMGRLGRRIRSEAGMAYSIHSRLGSHRWAGYWFVIGGFNPAQVDRGLSLILEELERASREGFTDEEVSDSKGHVTGSFDTMLESPSAMAGLLYTIESCGLGLDYPERFKREIWEIDRHELREVTARYMDPTGYAEVVVSP